MPLPSSSLTGVTLTATSGNPPVLVGTQTIPLSSLSLGQNFVTITDPGITSALNNVPQGSSINASVNCSYANGASVVSVTTPYTPPPPVAKASNGVTNKYTLSSIPLGQPNPYIFKQDGVYYAVMSNSQNSITKINNYARGSTDGFVPNGENSPVPFGNIVTTLMTNMDEMFKNPGQFNEDISSWDVSNVNSMQSMFTSASKFNNKNNPNISYWDTSKVTDMFAMFFNASLFNQDISTWTVSSVRPNPMPLFSIGSSLTSTLIPKF